jgi:ATP-dependent DNA helicase RecG
MDDQYLRDLVTRLRRSDETSVEVKRAAGGFPESAVSSMCALANLPGGGIIIFGLDEDAGFAAVDLGDIKRLKTNIANRARQAFQPPLQIEVTDHDFEGRRIVVGKVGEVPSTQKPCIVRNSGVGYLRSFDGDFALSELEVQAFLTNRQHPAFDQAEVSQASVDDLDAELVVEFLTTARNRNMRLAPIADDNELLIRAGAVGKSGHPTLAGLLVLGIYPQQWFPNFTLQAALLPEQGARGAIRVLDSQRFDGPIPSMLKAATEWVSRSTPHAIVDDSTTGDVFDRPEFPTLAVRELIANALVHRDLAPWAMSRAVELRIMPRSLVITNPGGLFGVSVGLLGKAPLTSARNSSVARLCQHVRAGGTRVIEALATGIPTALVALEAADLAAPRFSDSGITFTVRLSSERLSASSKSQHALVPHARSSPTRAAQHVLEILTASGPLSAPDLARLLGVKPVTARKHLGQLVDADLVQQEGGRGEVGTVYRASTNNAVDDR